MNTASRHTANDAHSHHARFNRALHKLEQFARHAMPDAELVHDIAKSYSVEAAQLLNAHLTGRRAQCLNLPTLTGRIWCHTCIVCAHNGQAYTQTKNLHS